MTIFSRPISNLCLYEPFFGWSCMFTPLYFFAPLRRGQLFWGDDFYHWSEESETVICQDI